MDWIKDKIADRIGGRAFDQSGAYKFEVIHQLELKTAHHALTRLDFGIGEPDRVAPHCSIESLRKNCARAENRFYADNGADFFKRAAAQHMQRFFNVQLDPTREVLPIIGIKSGLGLLAGTLINPGDYVLCTSPGYPVFPTQTRYFGGQVIDLPLVPENQFLPDFSSVPDEIKSHVKCCVLNYPNNPTGATANKAFFEKLVKTALKYRWILIHDAAYAPLSFTEPLSLLSIPAARTCSVELHSMSKGFNMTGWRIGWMCGNKTVIQACTKLKSNSDAGQFLAIQRAATTALEHAHEIIPTNVKRYQRRIRKLIACLEQVGLHVYEPHGGFFVYVKAPKQVSNQTGKVIAHFSNAFACTCWLLEQLNLVTVPWDEVGAFLRFSVTFEAPSLQKENECFIQLRNRLAAYVFA